MKSKKVKTIQLKKDKQDKITPYKPLSKLNFINNPLEALYLDTNSYGELFYEQNIRLNSKWEFVYDQGSYYIKNSVTGLYISTDINSNLYCYMQEFNNSYQKWIIYETTEKDCFIIQNLCSKMELNTMNKNLILSLQSNPDDIEKTKLFKIFPKLADR
jgi:hypothetical protein